MIEALSLKTEDKQIGTLHNFGLKNLIEFETNFDNLIQENKEPEYHERYMKKWSDPPLYNCKNQNEGKVCMQSLVEPE